MVTKIMCDHEACDNTATWRGTLFGGHPNDRSLMVPVQSVDSCLLHLSSSFVELKGTAANPTTFQLALSKSRIFQESSKRYKESNPKDGWVREISFRPFDKEE